MSKVANAYADDKEGAELPKGAPPGQVSDSSYKTRMNEPVPVMGDNAPVEDPMRPGEADSDRQLGEFCLWRRVITVDKGWLMSVYQQSETSERLLIRPT